MKPISYKAISVAAIVSMATACGIMTPYKEADIGVKRAKEHVAHSRTFGDDQAAVYTTSAQVDLTPIQPPSGPSWLEADLIEPISVSQLPVDMAAELILRGTGIVVRFDSATSPNAKVNLNHTGSIRSGLDKIAAYTNYSYEASDNFIEWRAYETEVFTIPVSGGDYSYMIGKKQPRDEESQGGNQQQGAIDTSAFDVDRQQYSNTQASNLNVFNDAENTIRQVVGDYGLVTSSKSSSTIVVKTTPDRMQIVRTYMENQVSALSAQVLLELRVIQVTSSKNAQAGVNWAALKETTSSTLSFVGETATGSFTNSVPVAFSGSRNTNSGSVAAMISALEEQGNVSFLTEQTVLAPHGKVSEIEIGDIQGYLARSQTTNTMDIGSSVELVPGILQGGYTLYTLNHVFGDQVSMVISTRDSSIEPFEQIGTESNFIQLPRVKSNRLNLQQIVTDGTTVIAAAVRREEHVNNQSSPIKTGLASTYAEADTVVKDIIVMITPRIVRGI